MSINPTGEERFATPLEQAIADAPVALAFSVTGDDTIVVGVVTFREAMTALFAAKLAEGPMPLGDLEDIEVFLADWQQ